MSDEIIFVWDEVKSKLNFAKHKVTFQEASTVFYDENAKLISDPEHSENEDRFLILGFSSQLHMLIVCHCYKDNNTIRIISARKATKNEYNQYKGDDK